MTSRERGALAAVLLLALAFRLAVWPGVTREATTFAPLIDSEAYLLQALRVADGAPLVEGVTFQAPLYPWLLGWTLAATGCPGAVGVERVEQLPAATRERALFVGRALNLVLGLALVALLFALGRVLHSPAAGLAAAAFAAVSSPLVFYEAHLLKVSLAVLVLPLAMLLAMRALRRGTARSWLAVGIVLAGGGLVRGNMHLLNGGAALVLVVVGLARRTPGWGLRRAAWLGLGALLALTPVVVRNSLVAGRPVLSTAAGGTAFFLCNHAGNDTGLVEHTSLNRQVPRYEESDWAVRAEDAEGRALTPAEVGAFWMDRALADIRDDPARWLRLEVRKAGLLFSRYEAPDNTLVTLGEETIPWLRWTPSRWAVVLPMALAGALVLLWRRRERSPPGQGATLAVGTLGYAATLMLFNMTARFRMPVEPLGMVAAGVLLAELPRLVRDGTWPRRAAVLAALGLGVAAGRVSEGALGPLDRVELAGHRVTRYVNRAVMARSAGDLAAARADLERAARVSVEAGRAAPAVLVELAVLDRAEAFEAQSRGDLAAASEARRLARERAQAAVDLSPGHAPGHRLLGMLAYDVGDGDTAQRAFRAALAATPLDREARLYLCLSLVESGRAGEALDEARTLVEAHPDGDAGYGLLALALADRGEQEAAREALASYDRLAARAEAEGRVRQLPDLPAFAAIRLPSPP